MTAGLPYENIPSGKVEEMMVLVDQIKADKHTDKVNLAPGTYQDEQGRPWILPSIASAEKMMTEEIGLDHEYAPLQGVAGFTRQAAGLIFGDDYAQDRTASIQTVAGTGACHLAAAFLSEFYSFPLNKKQVHISSPTWSNYYGLFEKVGIAVVDYPHLGSDGRLDFDGLIGCLNEAEDGSVFVLHPGAHNPTGMDPTHTQWRQIVGRIKAKRHFVFLDSAYLGLTTGTIEVDRFAIDLCVAQNIPCLVAQSFSKNAGMYGERVGALHFPCPTKDAAQKIYVQLANISRAEHSTCPRHGAEAVLRVLSNVSLREQWYKDLKTMATRLQVIRKTLHEKLHQLNTPGRWDLLLEGNGMFFISDLTPDHVMALRERYHMYLPKTGRIALCGITPASIDRVAQAIHSVVSDLD